MIRRFAVCQLGARRHYLVARALFQRSMLSGLFTDFAAAGHPYRSLRRLPRRLLPAALRRMLDRCPQGIPGELIHDYPNFGLRYARRRRGITRSQRWIEGGQEFCRLIIKQGLGDASGVYAFTGAALELLLHARQTQRQAVLDQIMAPRRSETRLLQEQRTAFPDWEPAPDDDPHLEAYCQRQEAEWQAAEVIICGSQFVVDELRRCGGPADRCVVVPFAANPATALPATQRPAQRPLRVVTVGAVGLRKGSPHVLRAAQRLNGQMQFRMVGSVDVPPAIECELRRYVELTGPVPRSQVNEHLRWADVFLLPSLCEGSAGSVYEALAAALPAIVTPNAGTIIRDGVDGILIPANNSEAICDALQLLDSDRQQLQEMSCAAADAADRWNLDSYTDRLVDALQRPVDSIPSTETSL